MCYIANLVAREVFDSRADLTLEVEVILNTGKAGRAIVPSGCSKGKHEAVEVRDNDLSRFEGKGVLKAINVVTHIIKPHMVGLSPFDQRAIDEILLALDGTPNKQHLGANAVLGVSLAVAKAAANQLTMSLCDYIGQDCVKSMPLPIFSMLSGGMHGDGNADFQDFQIIPQGAADLEEALQIGKNVYRALKSILLQRGMCTGASGTGGLLPVLSSNEEGLRMLEQAIDLAGYCPGDDIGLSMDIAAEMFYANGVYHLKSEGRTVSTCEFTQYIEQLCDRYPIALIEDPLGEDDVEGWVALTQKLGDRIELVGDDLFTTNNARFQLGLSLKMANAILVKPNQIGTLTETLDMIRFAQASGYSVVMSRRSGETEDTCISDLAVATCCNKVKFGSLARLESMAKYNQLLRLKESLGDQALYR
ncbi:phosphopyruvate hydratase [Zooshikella sp. RANM57]|uniref:phosphopyruvate hydratase n=1 Tax=Zooshikella sp. RANM57 TaxID=3425863 RepID=UPI003D6E4224